MKTIDERIAVLEAIYPLPPGTQIVRQALAGGKVVNGQYIANMKWCLSIGQMGTPKDFFQGDTIEEVIKNAETHYKKLAKPRSRISRGSSKRGKVASGSKRNTKG